MQSSILGDTIASSTSIHNEALRSIGYHTYLNITGTCIIIYYGYLIHKIDWASPHLNLKIGAVIFMLTVIIKPSLYIANISCLMTN